MYVDETSFTFLVLPSDDLNRQAPLVVHPDNFDFLDRGSDGELVLDLDSLHLLLFHRDDPFSCTERELLGARSNCVPHDSRLDLFTNLVGVLDRGRWGEGKVEEVDRAVVEAEELDVQARGEDGSDEA